MPVGWMGVLRAQSVKLEISVEDMLIAVPRTPRCRAREDDATAGGGRRRGAARSEGTACAKAIAVSPRGPGYLCARS